MGVIEQGLVAYMFAQGSYNRRLDIISDNAKAEDLVAMIETGRNWLG